jgi:hypothetical protein
MSKRKRGRGLPPIPIDRAKSRLDANLKKIEAIPPRIPPPQEYGSIMENIRKDTDMLLKYAKTPEDKLKYTRIIFTTGQMYLWYPWSIGTLSKEEGRDYILGKSMQAENDQYTYLNILREKKEKEENDRRLKETLDILGATNVIFRKPKPGLRIRIPPKKPKPIRDYKNALDRKALAKNKIAKFLQLLRMRKRMFKANKSKENKKEWKLAKERWLAAREEYIEAKKDLPIKQKAYEEFKKRGPLAKPFKKL